MLDILLNRRSYRSFLDKKVEDEKIDKLVQAAQLSPSGKNTKPWEFIIIEDKDTLNKLGNTRNPKQVFLPNTPLAIVVLADTNKTDTWIEDASIASLIIQLEAEKLELGSCWVQIRMRESNQGISSEEYLRNILNIPNNMAILSIIAIGYKNEKKNSHTLDEIDIRKIHKERY